MPTVDLLPNGYYIYMYEFGGFHGTSTYDFRVTYRLSKDPTKFDEADDHPLVTQDGAMPTGSPYVVWSSYGGPNGTIIASASCCSEIYVNQALGAEDAWVSVSVPETRSYTRSLRVFEENAQWIVVAGGGKLNADHEVTASVIDISTLSF